MTLVIFILVFVWCMAMYEVFEGFWTAMLMGLIGGILINVIAAILTIAAGS